jgi:HK97 family phage major capsid protein
MNTVELRQAIHAKVLRCKELVDNAKAEIREFTEDEQKEFDNTKTEIEELKSKLNELEEKLRAYEEQLPEDAPEKEDETEKNIEQKSKMNKTLIGEIRSAMDNNTKNFTFNAETRAVTVSDNHDNVVETKVEGILDPLYANSVLTNLGARFYTGLPMGDVVIPVLGKGTVGWETEIAEANATGHTTTSVKLQPKRLTAYVDISKKLIAQDNAGVEASIRADIVKAINDKLEATIFGENPKTDSYPAGIFADASLKTITSFKTLVDFEAELDDANVVGEKKYVLSNKSRAALRAMQKGEGIGLVLENAAVDGTPAFYTSNVPANKLVYGDFSNLAIGSWGDIDITVDEYTQATKGCVRLVINAYFDAVKLREAAFVYGTTETV